MIFSELYSAYYNAVAGILTHVLRGGTDEKEWRKIVELTAFSESAAAILPALKNAKWPLLRPDGTTPIRHIPSMPMTLLEKQWLKALSLDARIRLFDLSFEGLEDVDPLFTPEDYVIYDQYADGDPYGDEGYITRFRTILQALREKQPLTIETVNRRGRVMQMNVLPVRLEYSEKDDKFRLIARGGRHGGTFNVARMIRCRIYNGQGFVPVEGKKTAFKTATLKILDERNALERAMLHFAHFEKRAERLDDRRYLLHIRYDPDDETEMVIRVLGFGPLLEATEPEDFRRLIADRLYRQKSCGLF